ncbi:lactoylglutathione lyase [Thioclava sp. ES.031]|uniref:VOC family protein n=1 Tax=Thioclava sp. ES.031 TaxID=1798203 RepID=UPI000BF96735|nr:VOC family protein [Thioclava sp. ES.031]PFG62293.1 lactoylglutathione lyase [Thioclava sp. ES.031]
MVETASDETTLASLVACHGIILFTENYEACVEFYQTKLGLPFWYEKESLTCLRFGDGYLMIETEGVASKGRKTRSENPTALRFNVPDVPAAARLLEAQGISVEVNDYSWGTTGAFLDPDGNICSLKNADDPYFR